MNEQTSPEVVVITGASAGVGRAIARRFAEDGASIGLIARNVERLEEAANEVRDAGGRALPLAVDVADASALERAAEAVENELGPIDIWINAAMVTVFSPVSKMTAEEYRRVTEVTYLGCVHGTQAALTRMLGRDRGCIVQIGCSLAYRSLPLQSAYSAAKHAVVGFTDSLRSELAHDDSSVQLMVAHLPAVNTPQFEWARNKLLRRPRPLAPIFEPGVIAAAVHYAAHHPRREYWIGHTAMKSIIGQRVASGIAERRFASQAWHAQMTEEPVSDARDNLFDSVPGNFAARGRFSDRATGAAATLRASEYRPAMTAVGVFSLLALAGVAVALLAVSGRQGNR